MEVSDQELRAMVRDAVARHTGQTGVAAGAPRPQTIERAHPSHVRFLVATGGDADGMCVIEPAVRCTHCGYCQSYGH